MSRQNRLTIGGIVLAAILGVSSAGGADRPNIVVILADDLGINDLHCYGRAEHVTPHLDRLAKEGVQFTTAYCAQPICSPARAALMTGKTPARLHLTTFLPGRRDANSQLLLHPQINQQLPLAETTIAEDLKAAGYATGCVGKWHLGGAGFGPKEQGFDFYHPGKANTTPSSSEGGKGEFNLTGAAEQFITENKDRPFFLYLAHNNPHVVLNAQQALIEKHAAAFNPIYAAMIETLDVSIGRLLARIAELDLHKNTLVIFLSDNGGLHVPETPNTPATHNSPYRAGKGFVYEGGLRVPLIMRWPEKIAAGKIISEPVIQTDLVPTLLSIAGVKATTEFDGVDLSPLFAGKQLAERDLCWHFPHYTNQGSKPAGAIRSGDWKLVEHYEDGQLELFNLRDDVRETKNLAEQEPERAKKLQAKLAAWRKEVGAQENTRNPNFDAAAHRVIYHDTDVSKLQPQKTAVETAAPLKSWRAAMDAAVSRSPSESKKGK
jgi:arylsulfatase A-like enzyme